MYECVVIFSSIMGYVYFRALPMCQCVVIFSGIMADVYFRKVSMCECFVTFSSIMVHVSLRYIVCLCWIIHTLHHTFSALLISLYVINIVYSEIKFIKTVFTYTIKSGFENQQSHILQHLSCRETMRSKTLDVHDSTLWTLWALMHKFCNHWQVYQVKWVTLSASSGCEPSRKHANHLLWNVETIIALTAIIDYHVNCTISI